MAFLQPRFVNAIGIGYPTHNVKQVITIAAIKWLPLSAENPDE